MVLYVRRSHQKSYLQINRLHDDAMAPSSHHTRDDELQIFINLLAWMAIIPINRLVYVGTILVGFVLTMVPTNADFIISNIF